MLTKRHGAAMKVARQLAPSERDLQSSMIGNARLTIAIIEARADAKLSIERGADALRHNAEAALSLATAWCTTAMVHKALRQDQHEMGLDAYSFGDFDECDDAFVKGDLKVVKAA